MTANDLLSDRRDLILHCLAILRKRPFTQLTMLVDTSTRTISVKTQNLDRLDVLFDGHPGSSHPIANGGPMSMTYPGNVHLVELVGYAGDTVCQRRRLAV